jgi:hypothetical protein
MKRQIQFVLSTVMIAAVAIVGPAFCLSRSPRMQYRVDGDSLPIRRSVIKVHTAHGVVKIPGNADSWDAAERAVFVADSIADMEIVNNEIPWRIAVE